MLDWISANSSAVSAAAAIVTAVIWLVYLQLMYLTFRAGRRPMITITRAMGEGREGHCLIANMSAAPVYVLTILAVLDDDGGRRVCAVTDEENLSEQESITKHTHQGPLESGQHFDLGPFDAMIGRARAVGPERDGGDESSFGGIEITVIALYGSSRRFVGASRSFERVAGDPQHLRPTTLETEQLVGFRSRRRMRKLLRENL